jgi:hypothetical protein
MAQQHQINSVGALVTGLVRGGALILAVMAASIFFASGAASMHLDAGTASI